MTESRRLIAENLDQPLPAPAQAIVDKLAARTGVAAILFYGNRLRDKKADGLLDLYILTDSNKAYHGARVPAFFNWLLPPNVYFEETSLNEEVVTAKVAVMTISAFHARMTPERLDTTLWARFSQPAILAYARDDESRDKVFEAIDKAHKTASWWAAHLATNQTSAREVWANLFANTYAVELRVESAARAETIVERAPRLYSSLYDTFIVKQAISTTEHQRALNAWRRRRIVGKFLNFVRLLKAATTFSGGLAYALSKVERHSGRPVELKAWERRFPWIAAPIIFCRLLIERRLR